MRTIDLNADLGEGAGTDQKLLPLVSSANIACGFHAGDPALMLKTAGLAKASGAAIGAHPGFLDRENFGRTEMQVAPSLLRAQIIYQIGAAAGIARSVGSALRHVKPHGALYNMAARDLELAKTVAEAVAAFDRELRLFAPPASALARAGKAAGLRVVGEFFADRNYLADGSLVPRSRPEALLHDQVHVTERLLRLLETGKVRTIEGSDLSLEIGTVCLHGDTPQAVDFARSLRRALSAAGVTIQAP